MPTHNPNRTIVIGCDQLTDLTFVLNGINLVPLEGCSVVTISRSSELIQFVHSNTPDLIIMAFEDNQTLLNRLCSALSAKKCPIFCLVKKGRLNALSLPSSRPVFTYPLDLGGDEYMVGYQVSSILQMVDSRVGVVSQQQQYNEEPKGDDLTKYILELDQKLALIDRLKKEIEQVSIVASDPIRKKLNSMLSLIKQVKVDEEHWDDFEKYFNAIHFDFLEILSEKYPVLTTKDLKYCCYLKMNLSNNEIMRLTGVNQESVRTHKYRLKKKMALSKEQDLSNYLIRFSKRDGLKKIG